jgi:hypothetical protein
MNKDKRLDSLFGNGPAAAARAEQESRAEPEVLTLAQMDGSAETMRPADKEIARLHVILKDGSVRTFINDHLDVEHRFESGKFSLVFAGTKHWRIDVEGRNLWQVFDYLTLRRWPYLREATRDFAGDGETIITRIAIHDVTPQPAGAAS